MIRDVDRASLVSSLLRLRNDHSDSPPAVEVRAVLVVVVRDALSYVLNFPPGVFDLDTDLGEYGLDSVDGATLMAILEDDLDARFLPQDFEKLHTVNDIVDYLCRELVPDPMKPNYS